MTEQARRMKVYRKGLTDKESAQELGISEDTFRKWRQRNNLQPHKYKPRRIRTEAVTMSEALTPSQCEEMKEFLGWFLWAAEKKSKFDVGAFITAYRQELYGGRGVHEAVS